MLLWDHPIILHHLVTKLGLAGNIWEHTQKTFRYFWNVISFFLSSVSPFFDSFLHVLRLSFFSIMHMALCLVYFLVSLSILDLIHFHLVFILQTLAFDYWLLFLCLLGHFELHYFSFRRHQEDCQFLNDYQSASLFLILASWISEPDDLLWLLYSLP